MKRTALALLTLVLCLTPLQAEDTVELQKASELTAHLARIAKTLEMLQADQRVLMTLRRVELAERRLAPLRSRLNDAEGDVRTSKNEIEQLRTYAAQLEKEMEEAVRKGADPATIPNSDQLEQIKNMILLAEDRLAESERRVIEAEDDLTKRQRQIDILDEQLESFFEGLDTGR